jgi:hypothetical protein
MVVPVAQAVIAAGLAHVKVLALTTAAPVVRAASLDLLQIKDFVRPGNSKDAAALETGWRLMMTMLPVADPDETAAYLGLSYQELVEDVGAEEAASRYARDGRQAFLPHRLLQRILLVVQPDLVVATNSPRAERAAIEAARALALPSVCLVDLFCIDEVKWIGDAGYANKVCVLNDSVKQFLVSAGRAESQVVVTGNPAFDDLVDPIHIVVGAQLRHDRHWDGKRVLLWPTQVEPAWHPFNGTPGDAYLPERALKRVIDWVLSRDDCVLCIRPRAGHAPMALPGDPQIVIAGQDVDLPALLQAVDLVVTLNSTVGLEGHFAGTRLVQILGSVFDQAMPLKRYGVADEAVAIADVAAALDRCVLLPRNLPARFQLSATAGVLNVIRGFL